jgi:hypothetical protein
MEVGIQMDLAEILVEVPVVLLLVLPAKEILVQKVFHQTLDKVKWMKNKDPELMVGYNLNIGD